MIELIRKYTFEHHARKALSPRVKSVLSKIMVCRTPILDGHTYKCPSCDYEVNLYNSCGDRHCPQCAGARRADWLDKASELVLPAVPYFQVVFTLPDKLSALILGNRRPLYSLLFRSAWRSLERQLRQSGDFQPAALKVLHTWNQLLEHHPHLHVIVPGGGPSLDGRSWQSTRHPRQPWRKKPYLTDNTELGRAFRQSFTFSPRALPRRYYGGYHVSKRESYLELCRQLLDVAPPEPDPDAQEQAIGQGATDSLKCPRCQSEMNCIASRPRPSWRDVFDWRSYSSDPVLLPVHGIERYYVPDD